MMSAERLDGLPLFTRPPSVNVDTSRAAAATMADRTPALRRVVLCGVVAAGGATCDELEVQFTMRHQTCAARLRELELAGWVEKSDQRRATRSGRTARVYVATAKGLAALHQEAAA